MRLVKTFVLRLYVDSEAPERLCGDLNALPDSKANPFKNPAELIALLLFGNRKQHSSCQAPENSPPAQNLSGDPLP